jgi:sugar lactone lactonase YvrE
MAGTLSLGDPVCVADVGDICGEGAVWHDGEQAVYWTDINGSRVHRLTVASGELKTWKFPQPVTALTLTTWPDVLLVVQNSGVIFWKPASDTRSAPIYSLPEWPAARCNDARTDANGKLWIGTMQNNIDEDGSDIPIEKTLGRFFSLDSSGRERTWKRELIVGNTVAWSPDGNFLYTADSLRNQIYRFRFAADSTLSEECVWFGAHERGLPDGSCVDDEGYLWNCRYGGNCILRIAPDGTLDRIIEMPVPNPTTCTFGGSDGSTLYVTSAAAGNHGIPQNGGLFAIATNRCGLGENRFQLSEFPA